jgi:hypothetical protein
MVIEPECSTLLISKPIIFIIVIVYSHMIVSGPYVLITKQHDLIGLRGSVALNEMGR